MTLTLHLTPQQEARLREDAARQGAEILEYALQRLGLLDAGRYAHETEMTNAPARPLTQEERDTFYEEFAEGYETLPPFTPETLARATAYERD